VGAGVGASVGVGCGVAVGAIDGFALGDADGAVDATAVRTEGLGAALAGDDGVGVASLPHAPTINAMSNAAMTRIRSMTPPFSSVTRERSGRDGPIVGFLGERDDNGRAAWRRRPAIGAVGQSGSRDALPQGSSRHSRLTESAIRRATSGDRLPRTGSRPAVDVAR